jgi:hypothetical protein
MRLFKFFLLGVGIAMSANVWSAEGSCGHNEMRSWVDEEEVCYHLYGPMTEKWSLRNEAGLGSLSDCLVAAKDVYKAKRFECELQGKTAYRRDAIHRNWSRYQVAYKVMLERIQNGRN